MSWLRRPRVLVGLAVNGAYLLFYASGGTPAAPPPRLGPAAAHQIHWGPAYYRRAPSGPAPKVVTHRTGEGGQASVYPAEDLVLASDADRRLLFSPIYFASNPRAVLFRFYSFSRAQQYAGGSPMLITADGKYVWSGARTLHSVMPDGEGGVVESLSAEVPYGEFSRAAVGRSVRIRLGLEEIELSEGHLKALRDMVRCAEARACL